VDRQKIKSVIEGLIFALSEPVTTKELLKVVENVTAQEIESAIDELEDEYSKRNRGFHLERIAGGVQFRTLPEISGYVRAMKSIKPARLSRAALETLAIIAYNQPITRSGIEQIRGVESTGSIRSLIDRDLVEVVGKKDMPGRPLLYGATKRFLEVFGLKDLASLPPLKEIDETARDLAEESEVAPVDESFLPVPGEE
jgi:segregation and condensation protein B